MKPVRALGLIVIAVLTQAATITITNENLPRTAPSAAKARAAAPETSANLWLTAINRLRSAKHLPAVSLDAAMCDGARRQAELVAQTPANQRQNLSSRRMLEKLWDAAAYDGNPAWRIVSQQAGATAGPWSGFDLGSTLEGDISHIGVGSIERAGTRWTVINAVRRRVQLTGYHAGTYQPFERLWLRGKLLPGYDAPRLMLTRPNGTVSEIALTQNGDQFEYLLEVDGTKGRYMAEIMVNSRWGPAVAALLPVDVGVAYRAPDTVASDDRSLSLAEMRTRMLDLINADRQRFRLAPVRINERLNRMAQGHSDDMKQHKFFAHTSPFTGELGDRARTAHIPLMALGENIAVAASLTEAEEGLMASPAHRAMILDAQMTVVGIGIAGTDPGDKGPTKFWVTQNYAEHDPE